MLINMRYEGNNVQYGRFDWNAQPLKQLTVQWIAAGVKSQRVEIISGNGHQW